MAYAAGIWLPGRQVAVDLVRVARAREAGMKVASQAMWTKGRGLVGCAWRPVSGVRTNREARYKTQRIDPYEKQSAQTTGARLKCLAIVLDRDTCSC